MVESKKGCVYFFKHVGIDGIKIGYSANESPIDRFEQFKTYAPYGAELIGFVRSKDPLSLERELHIKYAMVRMYGEWFDISRKDAEREIALNSELADIDEMNSFQIAWAKRFEKKPESMEFEKSEFEFKLKNDQEIRNKILNCPDYTVTLKFFSDMITDRPMFAKRRKALNEVVTSLFGEPNSYRWSTRRLREVIGSDY